VIFAVQSGQITAEEGARRLGVSRKTYYEWENRALEAMEKERLRSEISALQNELFVAKKTVEVRDMLHAYELHKAGVKKGAEEKKQKRKKRQ
jgi:transcriptional regulator with XRE-family HTH domain